VKSVASRAEVTLRAGGGEHRVPLLAEGTPWLSGVARDAVGNAIRARAPIWREGGEQLVVEASGSPGDAPGEPISMLAAAWPDHRAVVVGNVRRSGYALALAGLPTYARPGFENRWRGAD
jgi:hypothetical protein